VWQEAEALSVRVRALEPARRPLEEVFLETLKAAAVADAGERRGGADAAP
jgi:hypothetical protein